MPSKYKRNRRGKIDELFHIYKGIYKGEKDDLHTFSLAKHIVTRRHMGVRPWSITYSFIIGVYKRRGARKG